MAAVIPLIGALVLFFFTTTSFAAFSSNLCKQSGYTCYKVKNRDSWKSLFPDPTERDIVMRVNRINISLYPGLRIAIPDNLQGATLMDFAPLPKQIDPPGEKVVMVSLNPSVLAWGAYDAQGVLQSWGPASGGQNWCADVGRGCRTSAGTFKVYQMGGEGCRSSKFPLPRGGAPMPYCMFFRGGFALHGSHDVPGYNASHGCVRLFTQDAKWLQQDFMSGDLGTRVIVTHQM